MQVTQMNSEGDKINVGTSTQWDTMHVLRMN